jgi:hypothetical protein
MKFVKKPIVVESCQFVDGLTPAELFAVVGSLDKIDVSPEHILIDTLEGVMRADKGDWIIRGVKGEIYPCKPDIFAATYSPIVQAEPVFRDI